MENKLCRTCGKFNGEFVDIFKTEGLKEKIETCLPIVVSQDCLLPDTLCMECYRNVLVLYGFVKKCLQNIIILESQYNIKTSCLKSKRKHDRSTTTMGVGCGPVLQWPLPKDDVGVEDISYYKDKFRKFDVKLAGFEKSLQELDDLKPKIVDYPCSSSDEDSTNINNKRYFDDKENDLIREIAERKSLKRKSESVLCNRPKMFKLDTNRRKKRPPMKVKCKEMCDLQKIYDEIQVPTTMAIDQQQQHNPPSMVQKALPQICLLCDMQFDGPSLLAEHVFETHGIDMAQIVNNEPILEKKKKMIPNLVKIADLKAKRESEESMEIVENREEPPTLEPSYVCPLCPATLTNRSDLFQHLRQKHATKSHMICGLCLYMADSYLNLTDHIEICLLSHPISNPYICKVCKYNDDNHKAIENHVLVHDFLISFCKKENRIFDPADYIETNPDSENHKVYNCTECELSLSSFRDFTAHRRSEHSIFHCDLCNKFYGRNSHLWKHVNRLHKGHPSITCQFCYKTSASKYHLAQHFNKIHTSKTPKLKNGDIVEEEDFLNKKFEAFDFQSVRQSFMRQELEKNEQQQSAKVITTTPQHHHHMHHHTHHHQNRHNQHDLTLNMIDEGVEVPKEIDTSSNLYTNIITNYTPPQNNGEFKCPKCSKGFHKKTLLKKHKKNCRPRLQKDLLTRCKSCSRIFKDRQSLAKHLVNYHSEYACEICKEKVQSKCEIVSHIRFSHPDCHLFCQDCGNVLRKSEDLKAHCEDHQNSFVCQFCADLLPSKIKLKMHILSLHRKILSLSCGICLKLFETQHVLRDHVRLVHKDVLTPLTSCTVCGKNYGSKWKTFDHLNKSHGRIFKACKACLEVFDTDRDLEVHYESAHGASGKDKSTSAVATTAGAMKKDVMAPTTAIKKEVDDSADDKSSYSEESPYEPEEAVKISLLEKRLTAVPEKNSHQQQQQKKKVSSATAVAAAKKVKIETDFAPDQNGSNSSKRTVYVNSNDPSFCEICHKTWPAKKHLWQHYIRCHKLVAATVCGICLKTNDNYEMLQAHLQDTHPTLLHGQGFGSNFICRICGRYHNARSKLKLHMAIHENFDWSLLDNSYLKTNDTQEEDIEEEDDDINYESLIEQVECSSENDNEEENEETSSSSESDESETEGIKMEIESEEEEEDGEEEGDEDSSSRSGDVVKSEDNSDSEDEEEGDEDFDYSNDGKNMEYARHQDVVDSAVKSIVYEDDDYEDQDDQDPEYSDSAQENLNSHEIQSAVDSIL
ncbi:PREDICTED: zinc finger protein 26-like [Nicrophorus vespilloides]|uniref:Zinc finger protein 26-like n=1 Tax=Nicrophorus vespilloides TaxID=110193 RepID=A0ABM1MIY7_NICVS|nr:PREDICTED: zinc finger protein 26-like [Nicrophorus vespilloides]